MTNYKRHQEVRDTQEHTQLVNCALLAAYVYGQPGGWYCVCSGHIDGFRSDYAVIHSNPGDLECHVIRSVHVAGSEAVEYADELEGILAGQDERPLVAPITAEEIADTLAALREAATDAEVQDVEAWVEELCKEGVSDVAFCDWAAVADAVKHAAPLKGN